MEINFLEIIRGLFSLIGVGVALGFFAYCICVGISKGLRLKINTVNNNYYYKKGTDE